MEIRRLSRVGFCPQIEVNCSSSYSLLLTIFAEACKSNQCCSSSRRRKERKKWMKKKPDLIADSPGFSAENQRSAVLKLLGIDWSLAGNAGQVMILGQYSSLFSCSSSFLAEAQKKRNRFWPALQLNSDGSRLKVHPKIEMKSIVSSAARCLDWPEICQKVWRRIKQTFPVVFHSPFQCAKAFQRRGRVMSFAVHDEASRSVSRNQSQNWVGPSFAEMISGTPCFPRSLSWTTLTSNKQQQQKQQQ